MSICAPSRRIGAEAAVVEALREAERDPDPMLMYRTHNTRGIVYAALGQPAPAEQSMQKAVEAARSSGSLTLLSLALGNFADFQLRQGSFQRARELAEEGLALAQKAEDLGNESLTRAQPGSRPDCLPAAGAGAPAGAALDSDQRGPGG